MAEATVDFVSVEFVGGPWDGEGGYRRHPDNVPPEIRVPLTSSQPWIAQAEAASLPSLRAGAYRLDRSVPHEIVTLTKEAIVKCRQPYAAVRWTMYGRLPLLYRWEGER